MFFVNTLCLVLLFEVVMYKIPFVTLFVAIMGSVWVSLMS